MTKEYVKLELDMLDAGDLTMIRYYLENVIRSWSSHTDEKIKAKRCLAFLAQIPERRGK